MFLMRAPLRNIHSICSRLMMMSHHHPRSHVVTHHRPGTLHLRYLVDFGDGDVWVEKELTPADFDVIASAEQNEGRYKRKMESRDEP